MGNFVRTRIRCAIYPALVGTPFKVVVTGDIPKAFKGCGLEFEFAFMDGTDLMDVSNIASVSVSVKPSNSPGSAAEMFKTVAAPLINTGLTPVAWQNGTDQHVVIPFLGSETAIGAGMHDITISGFTNDNVIDPDVFGISTFEIKDAGIANLVIPPLNGTPAATVDDIKGLLAGYLKAVLPPGQTITFTSTDTKVKRIMGVENGNPAGAPEILRVDSEEIES